MDPNTLTTHVHSEVENTLKEFLDKNGPCICEVFTDPNELHEPKVIAKLSDNGKFIPGELHNIRWAD